MNIKQPGCVTVGDKLLGFSCHLLGRCRSPKERDGLVTRFWSSGRSLNGAQTRSARLQAGCIL